MIDCTASGSSSDIDIVIHEKCWINKQEAGWVGGLALDDICFVWNQYAMLPSKFPKGTSPRRHRINEQ